MKPLYFLSILLLISSCNFEETPQNETGNAPVESCEIPVPPRGGFYEETDFLQSCDTTLLKGNWKLVQLTCGNAYVDLCRGNINSIRVNIDGSLKSTTTASHSSRCTQVTTESNVFAPTTSEIISSQTGESCTPNSECSSFCNGIRAAETYKCKSNGSNVVFMKTSRGDICSGSATEQVLVKISN